MDTPPRTARKPRPLADLFFGPADTSPGDGAAPFGDNLFIADRLAAGAAGDLFWLDATDLAANDAVGREAAGAQRRAAVESAIASA